MTITQTFRAAWLLAIERLARKLILLIAAVAIIAFPADPQATDSGPLPPVYFNHADIVLDPAAFEAIGQAVFLKEKFSNVSESTGSRRPTDGVPVINIAGKRTYLAIFKPAERLPEHQINFNMWIDDRTKLPLIRDSLRSKTKVDATLVPQQRRIDGKLINSFDMTRAVFPSAAEEVRRETSVIARYPAALPSPDRALQYVTREKDQASRYMPDRLFSDITGFAVTVNTSEAEQLEAQFDAYGYSIKRDGRKRIVIGPEITIVLLTAESGSQRGLAIDMKLNRAKTGDQAYQFGQGSELIFNGDTATWYFPAGWRP